jgi:hypothetical protein
MEDILAGAGIIITKENRKDIDKAFHKIVDVDYKNCPDAWKKIKEILKGNDEISKTDFKNKLKNILQ